MKHAQSLSLLPACRPLYDTTTGVDGRAQGATQQDKADKKSGMCEIGPKEALHACNLEIHYR